MKTYDEVISKKLRKPKHYGFAPIEPVNERLFDWQKLIVRWAIKQGRCALFEDCGLGKTPQQLEWASQVVRHSSSSVLILAPLAVAEQTVREGRKFGIHVEHVRDDSECFKTGIYITNYERLNKFDGMIQDIAGVVLDESSILKAFMGKTRMALTEAFSHTPFRLCCTATPAPNDYMEFGQHCDFLGVMDSNEMLSRYFINDTMSFGTYRLKGHARKDFWRWVSTWAACISKPSDIGFNDGAFNLPPLNMETVLVSVDQTQCAADGELFRCASINATSMHKEMRLTCQDRVDAAARIANGTTEPVIVWCNTNYEADALRIAIPDAVEVRGNDSSDDKEEKLNAFTTGKARIIITKPSIAGYGLNWEHCSTVVFVGLSYSFEDFYQAIRRSYRFGQRKAVNCYVIQASTEESIMSTVQRKMKQHDEMKNEMKMAADHIRNEQDQALTTRTDITQVCGGDWTMYLGDCVRVMQSMKDASIDFSVYSPPFANLYIYSDDIQDMGNCNDDDEFFEQYLHVIKEKLRITKPGCLSAVHCKNLVNYKGRDGAAGLRDFRGRIIAAHVDAGWSYHSEFVVWKDPVIEMQRTKSQGLLFKQLKDDSRFCRAGLPDYVTVFRKWDVGMECNPVSHPEGERDAWNYIGTGEIPQWENERHREIQLWQKYASPVWNDIRQTNVLNGNIAREQQDEKHICPLQLDVISRLLWLYTRNGAVVFSPFTGIGSEGVCSIKMNRKFVGAELKESYFKTACDYLRQAESEKDDLFSVTT